MDNAQQWFAINWTLRNSQLTLNKTFPTEYKNKSSCVKRRRSMFRRMCVMDIGLYISFNNSLGVFLYYAFIKQANGLWRPMWSMDPQRSSSKRVLTCILSRQLWWITSECMNIESGMNLFPLIICLKIIWVIYRFLSRDSVKGTFR